MGSIFNLSAFEYLLRYRSEKPKRVVVPCISLGIVQISVAEIFVNRCRQFLLNISESYVQGREPGRTPGYIILSFSSGI